MPLLNLTIGVGYDGGDVTSQLESLSITDSTCSAGSVASADSYVYPEVDAFQDDDEERYDPYLKPLVKEDAKGNPSGDDFLSGKKSFVTKEPSTPDTARETTRDSSSSTQSFSFFHSCPSLSPPSFSPRRLLRIPKWVVQAPPSPPSILEFEEEEHPMLKERDYWNEIANQRLDNHGIVHLGTAEALMQLGNSHMRCYEYKDALLVFKGASRIFRSINGGNHPSLAMALKNVGIAACHVNKMEPNLRMAMDALNRALVIQHDVLGPTHVDTVETLNSIAGVHLHLNEFQDARQAYFEVWTLRKAIFGPHHPSVAVAAHCLGSAYVRLSRLDVALKYYQIALDIYDNLRLRTDHPTVERLLMDINMLDRIISGGR